MAGNETVFQRVERCVRKFALATGHDVAPLNERTDLARGLGLSSDEGLDLVLDLCDEFEFDFPRKFNPVVDDTGRRGRRLGELVSRIQELLRAAEVIHGTR